MKLRDQVLWALAFAACFAFAIGRLPEVLITPTSAADDLHPLVYPFPAEQGPWRIVHGNNGGRSPGDYQQFSLDFAAASGRSAGRTVLAPASGVVNWTDTGGATWDPHTDNCISIKVDGQSTYYVAVCHLRLDRVYNVGDRVARGDRIGVVGPKDDSSQFPHVQVTLYTAESPRAAGSPSDRKPAPFVGIWALSGCAYPVDGSGRPQYAGATGLPKQCPSAVAVPALPTTRVPLTTTTTQ